MLVLGIDPGTATTGYGLIKKEDNKLEAVEWGLIETDKESLLGKRFINIYTQVSDLIKKFKPDVVAMEKIFFATNAKTAISVGQAQGVMIYCFAKSKLEVFEYAPGTIKKVVAGGGKAKKKDIQRSLRKFFGSKIRSAKKKKSHFDDSADALAVALCHILLAKEEGVKKMFKVGKITHYYDKIGVAVVELDADLAVGDRIKFVRGGEDLFEQEVSSIQVEHNKLESAKKGDTVGLKTDQPVKEGTEIFKL